MRKCPPGIVCVENASMFFFILCLVFFCYFIYRSNTNSDSNLDSNSKTNIKQNIHVNSNPNNAYGFNYPYTRDALLDPYAPPLRDERYAVPINVSTNIGAVDTNYRQVGILTPQNQSSKDSILPLMGRPLFVNRDKWNYYTISNQHNNVKLPVSKGGRSCTNEYGCDKIYNGDSVYLDGINEAYNVTIYDNDTIKYLPI
jgi:hypothetical protein